MTTEQICSICKGPLEQKYGNNAQPINDGRCCNFCDNTVVIPTRIKMILESRKNAKDNS